MDCLHQSLEFQNEINNKRLYLSGRKCYEWFCEKMAGSRSDSQQSSNSHISRYSFRKSLSRLRHQKRKITIGGGVIDDPPE